MLGAGARRPRRAPGPIASATVLTTAAASTATFSVSLSLLLTVAAGVLGVLDAALRFRRTGGSALLSVVQLIVALLVIVAAFAPLHPFVSTTIPVRYLVVALALVLLVQLLVRSARKGAIVWLNIVALVVAAVAAVVAFLGIG